MRDEYCLRYPRVINHKGASVYPKTNIYDWCGEFSEKRRKIEDA